MALSPLVTLARIDDEALVLMLGLGTLALVFYVVHCVRKILETRAREQTKREIAAYVAEGSISPQDAAKMLMSSSEAASQIADGVAWGTVKPEKAEMLIRALGHEPASKGGK